MRRTPIVLQSEAAECGIACLAMVSGAHGRRMDLPAIRRHHDVSLKGTTLRDLIHVAGDIHLNTRALRAELHHLKQVRPALHPALGAQSFRRADACRGHI